MYHYECDRGTLKHYHICYREMQKNEDIEKTATFGVSDSILTQNTETATQRSSTEAALKKNLLNYSSSVNLVKVLENYI